MIFLNDEEIQAIFKNHLKIESKVMSIETMFSVRRLNSTKFDPYYQRNYVWDVDKATYFIESILLGTEIPPLVLFNNGTTFEVIDGRQRFETIKRFTENRLPLSSKGFYVLNTLAKKHFKDLDEEVKGIFLDTKLRIIEFRIVNEPRLDERKEDLIKKEIFRRYNSGITPLKSAEIESAKYIDDDITRHFKKHLTSSKEHYDLILDLFFQERDKDQNEKIGTRERVMKKVRELLVMPLLDITYYAKSSGRKSLAEMMYEHLSNATIDSQAVGELYDGFIEKITFLGEIKEDLDITNRLVYECLYWSLAILEKEAKHSYRTRRKEMKETFENFVKKNIGAFDTTASHFSKSIIDRYDTTAEMLKHKYGVNMKIYLENSEKIRQDAAKVASVKDPLAKKLSELEVLRINKPEPESTTIEDITNKMKRGRFLVRPPYQRGEVINKAKSSALIESILLDIQLPPIFIYKRTDGMSEVVDGQQRLLSILGYIGSDFVDENGQNAKSEKNSYKLGGLRILTELNKEGFKDLSEVQQNKILTFNLSVVNIDARLNPKFDPVDLFLRLNNKPYPIKENTFEMWNSYVDMETITTVKDAAIKHSGWFYIRQNNARMENEQLYVSLAYLDHKALKLHKDHHSFFDVIDFYQRGRNINVRIKRKYEITALLDELTDSPDVKKAFNISLSQTEKFIRKVKALLIDRDIADEKKLVSFLDDELNKVLDLREAKRTSQAIYLLWFILHQITIEMIRRNKSQIKTEITALMRFMKDTSTFGENVNAMTTFREFAERIWRQFDVAERLIHLSDGEKQTLVAAQENVCPLCKQSLYWGEELHIDHRIPIAAGGPDTPENLQATHAECNLKKGAEYVAEEMAV